MEIHGAMNFLIIFNNLCNLAEPPVKTNQREVGCWFFFPSSRHEYDTMLDPVVGKGQSLANCIIQVLFLIKVLGFGTGEEADG